MARMIDIRDVPVDKKESLEIAGLTSKAKEKYGLDNYKTNTLECMFTNIYKHFKVFQESNAAIVSGDIEPFRNIAIVATTKQYTSNILDKLVSVQSTDSPYGLVSYVDFQYADDHAPDGITAGDSLTKRSRTYGNHTEQTPSRRIKTKIEHRPITADVRSIEASYTLESWLALASIKGQNSASQFLDKGYLDVIANKLRDEAEFAVMDALYTACMPQHVTVFHADATECEEVECQARRLLDAIEDTAQMIFDTYKIWPNVVVLGSDALKILRRGDVKVINNYNKGTGIPSSVSRLYLGILEDRYNCLYDPELSGILLTQKDTGNEFASSGVYASVVPLAITPPITERDLSTYRVVYTVDAVDVIYPEIIGRVDIV